MDIMVSKLKCNENLGYALIRVMEDIETSERWNLHAAFLMEHVHDGVTWEDYCEKEARKRLVDTGLITQELFDEWARIGRVHLVIDYAYDEPIIVASEEI